jgi:para-nitrobenzyl esterase
MRSRILITALSGLMFAACSGSGGSGGPPDPIDPPPTLGPGQVSTAEGALQGVTEGDLLVFRGVRYAAPPVGDLRFKAPQPPAAFAGVRNALDFGSNCTQLAGAGTVGQEDCLYLNVWAHADDTIRPVMVYLHPGAGNGVGGDLASTEPSEFAEATDVIVVSLNRRIGALGYLAIDELVQENPRVTAGNYGLLDVIAALGWVQNNIASFNGDPNHVMVFGTSAGGQLSCQLLGAAEASGLLHGISLQSAPCGYGLLQSLNDASPFDSNQPNAVVSHREILTEAACDAAGDILACLRALSAEEVMLAAKTVEAAVGHPIYVSLVDGVVVQADPGKALEEQTIGDIPLIVGMAANEVGNRFQNLVLEDEANYQAAISAIFRAPFDAELYALYPSSNFASREEAFSTLFADVIFSCSAETLAYRAMGGAPSYLYEITRGFDSGSLAGRGAAHAIDSPYLFGTFGVFGYTPDAQALAISAAMRTAWSSLAGDPTTAPAISVDGTTLWPVYNDVSASYAEFGETISGRTGHRGNRCAGVRAVLL